MPIPFSSAVPDSHPREGELKGSKSERATAWQAFDHALNQELQELIQQAKQMAAEVKEPCGVMGVGAVSDATTKGDRSQRRVSEIKAHFRIRNPAP